jgi:RHS repeat-associated protein
VLTKVAGTDTTQYAWDFENRLIQVTLPGGTVVNYKYDVLGRRIQRTTSTGADERYVYDGQNVIQDLNSSSSIINSYLNGPGLDNHLRQTNATSSVSYFLTDHLSSTVGLTDASANLVEQTSYDSFGNHLASSRTRYTYTGRERDPDTGLMYYRARFYDPQAGRFINEDPIGLNGGINPYAYVSNRPTGLIDPSGLSQDGPVNYLRDPFPVDYVVANAAADTLSDLLLLDHIAHYSWQVEDRCLSNGERAWAGGKLVGATVILAAGGPIMKGAGRLLGAGAGLLSAGGGAGADLLGAGGDALIDGAAATSGAPELLLDTNAVIQNGQSLLSSGPNIVRPSITDVELQNLVRRGRLQMPRAAGEIPTVPDSMDINLRINVRGQLTPRVRGNFADGVIGATAIERNAILVTHDGNLLKAVMRLGGVGFKP